LAGGFALIMRIADIQLQRCQPSLTALLIDGIARGIHLP
jgi:hypothetical protein